MSTYRRPLRSDELMHYGVKGMHWGVRRYQNYDGTLKNRGKRHYTLNKIKSDGLSESQKETLKKTALIGGTIAVGAVVGSAAYMYGKNHLDRVIRAGTKMQTLSTDAHRLDNAGDHFYTAYKPGDKAQYKGFFGRDTYKNSPTYKQTKRNITATSSKNLKVASRASGDKVYRDMRKNNPEFRNLTENMQKGVRREHDGMRVKKGYDSFNYKLAKDDDPNIVKARKMFYEEMGKRGYSGIIDTNDTTYSKMRTNSSSIIFDKSSISNSSDNSKLLTNTEIGRNRVAGILATIGEHTGQYGGAAGVVAGTTYAGKQTDNMLLGKKKKGKRK